MRHFIFSPSSETILFHLRQQSPSASVVREVKELVVNDRALFMQGCDVLISMLGKLKNLPLATEESIKLGQDCVQEIIYLGAKGKDRSERKYAIDAVLEFSSFAKDPAAGIVFIAAHQKEIYADALAAIQTLISKKEHSGRAVPTFTDVLALIDLLKTCSSDEARADQTIGIILQRHEGLNVLGRYACTLKADFPKNEILERILLALGRSRDPEALKALEKIAEENPVAIPGVMEAFRNMGGANAAGSVGAIISRQKQANNMPLLCAGLKAMLDIHDKLVDPEWHVIDDAGIRDTRALLKSMVQNFLAPHQIAALFDRSKSVMPYLSTYVTDQDLDTLREICVRLDAIDMDGAGKQTHLVERFDMTRLSADGHRAEFARATTTQMVSDQLPPSNGDFRPSAGIPRSPASRL